MLKPLKESTVNFVAIPSAAVILGLFFLTYISSHNCAIAKVPRNTDTAGTSYHWNTISVAHNMWHLFRALYILVWELISHLRLQDRLSTLRMALISQMQPLNFYHGLVNKKTNTGVKCHQKGLNYKIYTEHANRNATK